MKRFSLQGLAAFSVLVTMLVASCKPDKLSVEEEKMPASPCRIKKIIQKIPGMGDRTGEFTYNAAGNPVNFTPKSYSTGSVKHEFRYDNKGRLTDYIGYYPTTAIPPVFEFWIRFEYDDKNRIIRDTTYYYGVYGATITTFHKFTGVTTYEYDAEKRVSRKVYKQYNGAVHTGVISDYKYTYNAEGNLVVPGAVYDDKVSIYSVNKLWMFLNCNYSKNNLLKGTKYNAFGLPLGFARVPQSGPFLTFVHFLGFNDTEIEYECN